MARRPAPEPMRRTVTVSSRVTEREKRLIQTTAKRLNTDVCTLLYNLAMAEAKRQRVFAGAQSED